MNKEQLNVNIQARTDEVEGYETNIVNYERMLSKLTREWCEQSLPYKHMENADVAPLIDTEWLLDKVADMNFKEKLKVSLRVEKLEQRKVKLILGVLQDQLNELNTTEGGTT